MSKTTRLFRPRGTPDCPISKVCYSPNRIMTDFILIHWHPDIELLYVEEGCFNMRADQNILQLSQGDIRLVTPGQIHGIQCTTPMGKYWSIAFSPELITLPKEHFFQKKFVGPLLSGKLMLPPVIHPHDAIYPELFSHLDRLLKCDVYSDAYKPTAFLSALSICTAVMPLCTPIIAMEDGLSKANVTIRNCIRFMQEHYGEKLTLQQIADSVYLHPNYLCALFKNYTGETVFNYLTQLRIQKAASMLRNESISVSQAAERCGFNNLSFFARKFRAIMGTTPKMYSKQR